MVYYFLFIQRYTTNFCLQAFRANTTLFIYLIIRVTFFVLCEVCTDKYLYLFSFSLNFRFNGRFYFVTLNFLPIMSTPRNTYNVIINDFKFTFFFHFSNSTLFLLNFSIHTSSFKLNRNNFKRDFRTVINT